MKGDFASAHLQLLVFIKLLYTSPNTSDHTNSEVADITKYSKALIP